MKKYCLNCMREISDGTFCADCAHQKIPETAAHQLKPGTVLNKKYLIGTVIEEGRFGITYIGRDLVLETKVAIKEFYPIGHIDRDNAVSNNLIISTEEQREFVRKRLDQFLDEAREAAKFPNTQGVAKVKDFFEENETAYIVMEYVEEKMFKSYSAPEGYREKPAKKKYLIPVIIGIAAAAIAAVALCWYFLQNDEKVETFGDYYVTGCKEVMKVRETKEKDSKVLTKLDNGEKVSLVEKSEGNYWKVYIEAEDVTGYINYHYLTNDSDAAMDPVTKYVNIEEGDTLAILSTPDADGASLGMAERGEEVAVLASPGDKYSYIYLAEEKAYGYVESSKLSDEKPEIAVSKETETKEVNTQTEILGAGSPPANYQGVYYVNVASGYLALRNAKAFDASNEIGKMYNGDYVYAIRTNEQYWYVYSPSLGAYGYTNSDYLVSSYSNVNFYSDYVYYANVSSGYLALRNARAYDASNEIGKIANGQEVDLIDASTGTYWYVYVPALDQYGYVNSEYLRN